SPRNVHAPGIMQPQIIGVDAGTIKCYNATSKPGNGEQETVNEIQQVSGSVERVTYYNEENGYSVIRLKPDSRRMLPFAYAPGRDGLLTIVGNLPEVTPGEWLKLTGR